MSRIHFITFARLNRSKSKVTAELRRLGLWDDRLYEVPVVLVPVGVAYGWHWYAGSGEIYIPRVSLLKLRDCFLGSYTSLADVLRHEFAHALSDVRRGLFRARRFTKAFGRPHDSDVRSDYDPTIHISPYATTKPSEDFAENFMVFVRHRGCLPPKQSSPVIRRKWRFIHALCYSIQGGQRVRWFRCMETSGPAKFRPFLRYNTIRKTRALPCQSRPFRVRS